MQVELLNLADFYKNVHDLPPNERPSDKVIADDSALDAHMERLAQKRAQEWARIGHA